MARLLGVVATTLDGTKAALLAAKHEADKEGAPILLLVPSVPPTPPADRFVDTTNWLVARYEQVAREVEQPVQVRVCAGPSAAEAAAMVSPADGTLFVGGPAHWLWPGAEERLAAKLRRAGREVVFVGYEKG